jgi:hypothetical protein
MKDDEKKLRAYIANYPDDPHEEAEYVKAYPGPIEEEPDAIVFEPATPPPRELGPVYPIKVGALCIVTTGEYSDYRILGVYRALKPFDKDTLRAAFVEAFAREGQEAFLDPRTELVMDASYFSDEAFVRWMLTEGYIAIMDAYTVHLHGYSTENFSIGIAPCGEDA